MNPPTTIGRRQLPCGHQHVKLPREPGHYTRRCKVCHHTYSFRVEPARAETSARLGPNIQLLIARWD